MTAHPRLSDGSECWLCHCVLAQGLFRLGQGGTPPKQQRAMRQSLRQTSEALRAADTAARAFGEAMTQAGAVPFEAEFGDCADRIRKAASALERLEPGIRDWLKAVRRAGTAGDLAWAVEIVRTLRGSGLSERRAVRLLSERISRIWAALESPEAFETYVTADARCAHFAPDTRFVEIQDELGQSTIWEVAPGDNPDGRMLTSGERRQLCRDTILGPSEPLSAAERRRLWGRGHLPRGSSLRARTQAWTGRITAALRAARMRQRSA